MVYCAATGSQYQVYMKLCLPEAGQARMWLLSSPVPIIHNPQSIRSFLIYILHTERNLLILYSTIYKL
jgi:hypothetical protein